MTQVCPSKSSIRKNIALLLMAVVPACSQPASAQTDARCSYIDDKALHETFLHDLTELFENGHAVEMKVLGTQLDRRFADLELPQLNQTEMDLPELYQRCKECVVIVGGLYMCDKCKKRHVGAMAGFVLTQSGVIATAFHGVARKELETIGAMTADGTVYAVKEIVAANRFDDIVLLQLDGTGFKPLGLQPAAPVGTSVAVIAHPSHQFYTLTTGTIARYFTLDFAGVETRWISATPDIGSGASGAPLLNMAGQVVGMASRTRPVFAVSHDDEPKRIQMMIKQYVPTRAILDLLAPNNNPARATSPNRRAQFNPSREFIYDMSLLMQNRTWKTIEEKATTWIVNHPDNLAPAAAIARQLVTMPHEESRHVAEQLARQILVKDLDSIDALQTLAMLMLIQERHEEAIQLNKRLLNLAPNDVTAMNNLAWILSQAMGRHEEAFKLTKKALELMPEYTDLLDTHGVICHHLERYEEAEIHLKKALEIHQKSESITPTSVLAHFHLAQVYWDSNRLEEARRLFRKCHDLQPTIGGLSPEQMTEATQKCKEE